MKAIVSFIFALLTGVSMLVVAETLEDRIKPVGSVCMAGDNCASAPVQVATAGEPRSGKVVYDTKCAICHNTGSAGAPKLGHAADWEARLGKGMDVLYTSAIKGFNGMPAMGLCFDCSESEIKVSVDYLIENSK